MSTKIQAPARRKKVLEPVPEKAPTKHRGLSPEEREQRIQELKDELNSAVSEVMSSPEQWVEFLETVSDFAAAYSWSNQMLIWKQCRRRGFFPTMVLPFGKRDGSSGWLKLGRHVTRGEKGLRIWRPAFKRYTEDEYAALPASARIRHPRDAQGRPPQRLVGFDIEHVFDISQTEGDDVVLPRTYTVRHQALVQGTLPVLLTGEDVTGSLQKVISLIEQEGYSFSRVPPTALGSANGRTTKLSDGTRRVWVRDDVQDAQAMKTAVHELAHILCGHLDDDAFDGHRGRHETEAESVAYIVCGALGMDTGQYSAPYVASWSQGDPEVVEAAAKKITDVSKRLLGALIPAEVSA